MNNKLIFGTIGTGIFAVVITPLVFLWIRTIFLIPGPTPCLGCSDFEGWFRFNSMFIPGIVILGIGVFFLFWNIWKTKKQKNLKDKGEII